MPNTVNMILKIDRTPSLEPMPNTGYACGENTVTNKKRIPKKSFIIALTRLAGAQGRLLNLL